MAVTSGFFDGWLVLDDAEVASVEAWFSDEFLDAVVTDLFPTPAVASASAPTPTLSPGGVASFTPAPAAAAAAAVTPAINSGITYRTSAAGGDTAGTSDRTVTITTATGDLLVVFVCLSGNDGSTATMTDDQGGTYFLVNIVPWSASANCLLAFVRDTLVTSGTSTIITCNSGSNTAGELVAIACSGSARAGYKAIRSAGWQANQASGATPTPVLDRAALTSNMTLVAVGSGDTTTTEPTNWTERQDVNQSTPTTALAVATRDSGFTGTSIAFGATAGANFASFAIELDGSPDAATELDYGIAATRQKIYHDPNETNTIGGTLTTHGTDLTVTSVANATDTITVPTNDMITTEGPLYLSGSNLPGGTDAVTPYYWIRSTATTGKLATSRQNAVAGTAVNLTSDGSGTITIVRTVDSQSNGRSAFITAAALGTWANSPEKPTDNKGNDYTALASSPISYLSFVNSKAGVWGLIRGAGGSDHTFSKTWAQEVPGSSTSSDEPTIMGLEVKGVGAIKTATQSEPNDAATIESNAVTVLGHSILVCVIFGHGPVGQDHSYTFKNGFEEWFQATNDADTHSNGYIQIAVGRRRVATGGSYTAKASGTSNEGGQMYLLGLEDIAFHEVAPGPAVASASGVTPTLTTGASTVTPAPAAASASAVDPTLTTPTQDFTPASAAASASSNPTPTYTLGGVNVTASPAAASAGTNPTPTLTTGNVNVAPAPASASAAAVNPTFTLGAVSLASSPAAASASLQTTPTLTTGPVTIASAPATTAAAATTPTFTLGAVPFTPAPAVASAAVVTPSLSTSGVNVTAAPAAASATAVTPALSTGTVSIAPAPAAAAATATTPTYTLGAVTVTPAPATAAAAVVTPLLQGGAQDLVPAPAAASAAATVPTFTLGAVSFSSAPATASATAVTPALSPGPVSLTASPAASAATAVTPSLTPGPVSLAGGAPAAATASAPTPTLTPGPSSITAAPAASAAAAGAPTLTPGAVTLVIPPSAAVAVAVTPIVRRVGDELKPAPASASALVVAPLLSVLATARVCLSDELEMRIRGALTEPAIVERTDVLRVADLSEVP